MSGSQRVRWSVSAKRPDGTEIAAHDISEDVAKSKFLGMIDRLSPEERDRLRDAKITDPQGSTRRFNLD